MSKMVPLAGSVRAVLFVGGDPFVSVAVEEILRSARFSVVCVATGQQALAQLRRWSPDLILLDIALPNMAGLTLLRLIRLRDGDVPVICLADRHKREELIGLS